MENISKSLKLSIVNANLIRISATENKNYYSQLDNLITERKKVAEYILKTEDEISLRNLYNIYHKYNDDILKILNI